MHLITRNFAVVVAIATLATGALVVTSLPLAAADTEVAIATSPAEHTAEAAKYDQEALDLEAKAARHLELAARYAALVSSGSKQAIAQGSISSHCKRLAKAYRKSAAEAREMAKMHREMAKAA